MYEQESARTAAISPETAARQVSFTKALSIMADFVSAAERMDDLKKALYYGKNAEAFAPEDQDDGFSFGLLQQPGADIFHGIMGQAGEAGEIVKLAYECLCDNQNLDAIDRQKLIEETGDQKWYHACIARALGVTFELIERVNVAKLLHRFPVDGSRPPRDVAAEARVIHEVLVSFPMAV